MGLFAGREVLYCNGGSISLEAMADREIPGA